MNTARSFTDILQLEFENRKKVNSAYSLRSFANKLGISPSKLSEVLSEKQGLSEKAALKICDALNYSESEKEFFLNVVRAKCAKSKRVQEEAIKFLENINLDASYRKLCEDEFSMISDWYNYALLELIITRDFQNNSFWIAKKLGITAKQAEETLNSLIKLNLVHYEGDRLVHTKNGRTTSDGVPSRSIRLFNQQVMVKAQKSIEEQTIDQRHLSTLTVAVDRNILPEVFNKISEFRKELNAYITKESEGTADTVYCFSSQLFELTNEEK